MYDDLIKQLRYCADATTCRNCFWKTECCPTDMQKKAADAIEELRKAVLRLEDESGIYDELPMYYIYPTKWIPVTERLPEDYELVLTCDDHQNIHMMSHTKKYKYPFGISPDHPRYFMVKYWMPLPEPPEECE